MTITGGHCHYMGGEVDGVDRVRLFARSLLKAGVDYLKMMGSGGGTPGTQHLRTTFSLEELRAAKEEAHRAGTHLAVHATNRDATRLVVEAGVDTVEHAILGTLDGDTAFTPDIADQMARQGSIVSPTFQASLGHIRTLEAMAKAGELSADGQTRLDYLKRRTDMKMEHCVQLSRHGVPLACSTDAGWSHNFFGDFADGLDMMASAGWSARETFRSVTEIPARALGKADTMGHLRPGAWGDAVVLRGNPTEDIKAVRQVDAVYLGGQAVNLDR
jgi:imidazolonepropionase-like amidohydrolase